MRRGLNVWGSNEFERLHERTVRKAGGRRKRMVRDEPLQARRRLVVQVSFCRTSNSRVLEKREQERRERRGARAAQGTGGVIQPHFETTDSPTLFRSR